MDNWNRIATESEAKRICIRNGIVNYEIFQRMAESLRYEGYRKAIQPFIQRKVDIHSLRVIDRIIVRDDGSIEQIEYTPLQPEAIEAISLLDELIAAEAERWGLRHD